MGFDSIGASYRTSLFAVVLGLAALVSVSPRRADAQQCQGGLCQGVAADAKICEQKMTGILDCSAQSIPSSIFCRVPKRNESIPKGYLFCYCSPNQIGSSGTKKPTKKQPVKAAKKPTAKVVTGCVGWTCAVGSDAAGCKSKFKCVPKQRSTCIAISTGEVLCGCS